MADVRYGQHLELQNNEIRNVKLHLVNGLPTPTAGTAGKIVFNTADGRAYVCDGSSYNLRATDSDALGGQNGAYYLSRANHTGLNPRL